MRNRSKLAFVVLPLAWLLGAAGQATALTVTFDVGPGGLLSSYTENGITVTPVLGFHVVDVSDHDSSGSRDLLNRPVCCSTPYDFAYSGGVFSVAKFDFVLNAGQQVFTASGGAMVSPGASGTVVLPAAGWTGITSFRWDANGTNSSTETALMDNLKFCPGDCNDGNVCTDDSCDPDNGAADGDGCIHVANTAGCNDGFFCNGADTCSGGGCTVHAGDPCASGGECANTCNETADNCLVTAGTACGDDGNVCTDDRCNGSGACVHPNNTGPCTDGQFCNGTDSCSGGSCTVHAGDPCTGGGECANSCNEGLDTCFRPAGTPCTNDGEVCTDDKCDGAGNCGHPNNAISCSDGTVCTTNDQCAGGSCVPGSPLDCDDGIDCTSDSCNSLSGCVHDAAAMNGTGCNDGNTCTGGDICNNGACVGTPLPINCDDGNACTLDTCNPLGGCDHDAAARDGFSCDDANSCTQNDSCTGGVCVGNFVEADTDGDGYCDRIENGAGCNPNDAAEIPPQGAAFAGKPGRGPGEGFITYNVPTVYRVTVATDPSCQASGTCGPLGFCAAGAVGDPCAADADCALPANTCRIVVNYGDAPDLSLVYALFARVPHPGFIPANPGCSRKVNLTLDMSRATNRLKLKAQGTIFDSLRRDADSFRYLTR